MEGQGEGPATPSVRVYHLEEGRGVRGVCGLLLR